MRVHTGARVLLVALLSAAAQDPLREALNLGHTRDQALFDSFTRGYQLTTTGTMERAVMLVREREAVGDYIQDSRTLSNAPAPFAGRVTIIVEARLNPLNTFMKP